ncbi:hypothetical protein [Trichormus variabilis]|jgi:hypothetical protein|uniref:Uncharacterized protein n=1 Tax=Trichormus variabilis SAG 1403-4b TaxID=447716 RepID=A0A433V1F8_ANAVA|nr:hypothetical protein [Trichormus variabilis]MBD2627284.1 hypothetical protein [Trichormus variabilis FACHB-164]RUS99920.1 hypothetical protein DSM107003_05040 [Trichormus variabilis SAG 1403-4b]
MATIVISNLNSQDETILFHDLSPAETETVSGGSGGSVNNYFITTNTGDVQGPTTGDIKGVDSGIRDNKIGTIDYSRSTYIVINSW